MPRTGTAAVTGAGSGIGQGIALELGRRGYMVLALVQFEEHRAGLLEAWSGPADRLATAVVDLSDAGDLRDLELPSDLVVLVNCAGVRFEKLPVEELPLEEWRRYFEVNFFAAVELTRRAVPIMRKARRGVICNIGSATLCNPIPFIGPYRATKGALSAFSETLRTEVAPFGIRVVEMLPGAVDTRLNHTSSRAGVSDALGVEAYAPMARKQLDLYREPDIIRNGIFTAPVQVAEVAIRVADVIDGDGARMRHGTCDRSWATIDAWRAEGGEPVMAEYIDRLLPRDGAR